ncbi:MAG: amidohydrolase [Bacteroidetes bacterium]|nr:amidohydrolase [Bacteroidota bacterium]
MENLKISIVQTILHWENVDANLKHFDEKINSIIEQTDIIVLPEMFTTGFAVDRTTIAEEHGEKGLQWMIAKSKEKNAAITGSIAVKENGNLVNRLYWVEPSGKVLHYDKRHLFRMAGENNHFKAGQEKIIIEYKGWKICPLVCYDLRFPVWSRNKWKMVDGEMQAEYDVLLYVANWPEVRSYPWKQLLIARAIENQSFVIGVNRIGKDGNDFAHSGDSAVINPRGEVLTKLIAHQDAIESIEIKAEYLKEFRKVFPVGLDTDDFELK